MARESREPARKLPGLERWIHEWAETEGETAARLRRRIGVVALAAMLEASTTENGAPRFLFKGGSALELRFARQARVSKDVDLAFRGPFDQAIDHLREAVHLEWGPFSARVKDPEPLTIPWAEVEGLRVDVALFYAGRPYNTLSVELVTSTVDDVDLVTAISLDPVGLTSPESIPCLSLRYQVAEKLHACSDPLDGLRENDRVWDVMDLILIEDLSFVGADLAAVRAACADVFEQRDRHPWPPVVSPSKSWPLAWERLVAEHDFKVTILDDAVDRVNAFIERIESER